MKIFRFAIDMITLDIKKFILSVLLLVIALVLEMFCVKTYVEAIYSGISADKTLKSGIEGTAFIKLDFLNTDTTRNMEDFVKEVYESEEVEAIGSFLTYGIDGFDELRVIQRGHARNYANTVDDLLEIVSINTQTMELCELKLQSGKYVDELDFQNGEVSYLYLGSGYADSVPAGTVYVQESGRKTIIAGIMEEGQRWISESLNGRYYTDELDYSFDCTYAVFSVIESGNRINSLFLTASEGYTIDEAIAVTDEVAEKYDISYTCDKLSDMYKEANKENEALISYLIKLLVLIIITTLTMLISTQVVIMLGNTKNYGVMYSVGFSQKEIGAMLLCRQFIMAICAIILSGAAMYYVAYTEYELSVDMDYVLKTILGTYVYPAGILMSAVMVGIVHIVTIIVLKRMTPVKLIRSNL